MGSQNSPMDSHPRFGFTPRTIFNGVLTDASLVGPAVSRVQGLRFVVVPGTFSLTGGAGEVKLLLEGSNDGVNWFVCAETDLTDLFTTDGQVEILNSQGSGQVDLEHFAWVRVRASIESGAPTFSLQTAISGIARDSEKFLRENDFVRSGATPTLQTGTGYKRPEGTRLVNVQVTASGVVLAGAASFDVVLQGLPHQTGQWFDIATVEVTGDGSQLMDDDGERFFSLGSFSEFRIEVRDNGVAGGGAAFEISTFISLDSADWTADGDESSGTPFDPTEVFTQVNFGAPGAEAGDTISITMQLFDADGGVLNEVRKVECILYDTARAGDLDLAFNATFDALTAGSVISGLGTNRIVFRTDASGQATFDILDAAVETVYLTAVNSRSNRSVPMYIARAAEATLAFA